MHCPSDHSTIVPHVIDGTAVHRCPTCEGIFLPGGLFREIRAGAAIQAHRQKESVTEEIKQQLRKLNCPNDANPMMSFMFKGVEIDVCAKCYGVWLDRGEIERITSQIGLPKKSNLSKIGESLAPLSASSNVRMQDISDLGDLLEIVFDVCTLFSDISS